MNAIVTMFIFLAIVILLFYLYAYWFTTGVKWLNPRVLIFCMLASLGLAMLALLSLPVNYFF